MDRRGGKVLKDEKVRYKRRDWKGKQKRKVKKREKEKRRNKRKKSGFKQIQ